MQLCIRRISFLVGGAANLMSDHIRETIIDRAQKLGLTAYAIAKQCSGERTPDPDTVKRYLSRRVSLNSRYVAQICEVLGLELQPRAVSAPRVVPSAKRPH